MGRIRDIQEYGQSVWLDYIRRDLISSGDLGNLVDEGLSGMTSNPTIFHKAIADSTDYNGAIQAILESTPKASAETIYETLSVEDIRNAADTLRTVYDETDGLDGLVSIEPSAHLAYDTDATIKEVRRLWDLVDRPNIMVKVPATSEGIPATEQLISEGININITLMFSMKHYEDVSRAYIRGIEKLDNPHRVASVASFFVSRVDTYVDRELEKIGTQRGLGLKGEAAIANSKLVYRRFREVFLGQPFAGQMRRGARIQRVLWGSTSTKNPSYSDVKYVEGLIGPYTVNTMPPKTLDAFKNHGKAALTLEDNIWASERVIEELHEVSINLEETTEQLQKDGVQAFADSMDNLMSDLRDRKDKILAEVS
jgi:transaldolase